MLPVKNPRKPRSRRKSGGQPKLRKSPDNLSGGKQVRPKLVQNLDKKSKESAFPELTLKPNNQNQNPDHIWSPKKKTRQAESSGRQKGADVNNNANANNKNSRDKNHSDSRGNKQANKDAQADAQTTITKRSVDSKATDATDKTGGNLEYEGSESLCNTHRLRRDGFKTPQDYRNVIARISSPSQMSIETCSHYYKIPEGKFHTPDDVFRYRGYKKICKIDEGAFGVVSKAKRLFDGKLFAVKEVDLSKKRAKRIQEMRRELFVLQRVEHRHIVHMIEHFVIGNNLVIIMELCEGGNLTVHLKTCPLGEAEAMFLFKQMAMSIKVLHRKGIAHRDVKLNNFLLDAQRKLIKISDFGLSVVGWRKSKGLLIAHTYCGTEPYMAPEILRRNMNGIRTYNPFYADMWSLGICLYAMLTQTFPFKVTTNHENLLKAQIGRSWKFPKSLRSTISEELKDLVWHLLDPEPGRRITINDTMLHPWLNPHSRISRSNRPVANTQIVIPATTQANIASSH